MSKPKIIINARNAEDFINQVKLKRHLRPRSLKNSIYVLRGYTEPVNGSDLLVALSAAGFTSTEAEIVLGFSHNTLIRLANELGQPFSRNTTRKGTKKSGGYYDGVADPSENEAAKPEEPAPAAPVKGITLRQLIQDANACGKEVGRNGSEPVYCGKPGRPIAHKNGDIEPLCRNHTPAHLKGGPR